MQIWRWGRYKNKILKIWITDSFIIYPIFLQLIKFKGIYFNNLRIIILI